MNLIEKRQKELIQQFQSFSHWEERYKKIIDFGKSLPSLEDQHRIEVNKVSGCQSEVWMIARINQNQKIIYQADSDALIVKGLIFLLLRIYSHSTPEEIIESRVTFIKEMNLDQNLSMGRTNGLMALIKKIKFYALAFKEMKKEFKKRV